MILVDDGIQVRNPFTDRFCFRPLAIQAANGQNNSYKQTTKKHQPTKQPKLNDSPKSNRIATKQATYLRATGLQSTDQTIDQIIGQIQAQILAPFLRSELVKFWIKV